MANRIRKALALQSATVPVITAPVAPIGHNVAPVASVAPVAPAANAARDNVPAIAMPSDMQLQHLSNLVASGVRNKHETRAAIVAALGGTTPSDPVKAKVRETFCVAHILANAKIDLPDMSPAGRVKWCKLAYSDGATRKADELALKAYNAAKSAWSLALADAGIGGAKTTKQKNAGANERRAPDGDGQPAPAPTPAPAKVYNAAEALAHITQQANLLQMFCNKNAGVVPGTIADAVSRLYTACTTAAKPA